MACTTHPSSNIITLKNDLFCNYDSTVPPLNNLFHGPTVFVRLVLQFLQFWDTEDVLILHTWIDLDWADGRLLWDPASYSGLSRITVDIHELWSPDLILYPAYNEEEASLLPQNLSCAIQNTGNVSCSSPLVLSSRCHMDTRNWPYDVSNCTIEISSVVHTSKEMDLQLHSLSVDLSSFQQSRDWNLSLFDANRKNSSNGNDTYSWLEYNAILERHSKGHNAVVVVPALVLVVMTLSSFWVEPECSERIVLCCCNVASHVIFMLYMIYMVSNNASSLPLVIRFYVDSFVLASLTTVNSVITYALSKRNVVPPAFVSRHTNNITKSYIGKFLIPEDITPKGNEDEENEQEVNEAQSSCKQTVPYEWKIMAVLVDRAVFYLYILIIFILMHRFLM